MGMETLNTAARAAGFAMAASDEPYEEAKAEATAEPTGWRPTEAVMLTSMPIERHYRMGDWLRTMLGLFGRRAPASPA
jgi:hypothetical protein